MGRLVIELWIFMMVQFMVLGRIISCGLSLLWKIIMVALVRVVKIRIWIKPQVGEIGVHLLIWKFGALSPRWTIIGTMIRIWAIWTWFIEVEIVRVVGWSRSPPIRWIMLCIKFAIIIKRKIHASLSLFIMQISHIKHQPYFFKKNI
jgi:hypothetical protein